MKKFDYDLGILNGNVYIDGTFINTSIGIKKNKISHIGDLKAKQCLKSIKLE